MQRLRSINPKTALVWGAGAFLGLSVVVGFIALPARTWSAQSGRKEAAQQEIVQLTDDIERLTAELELLQSDAEIERRAREDFGLVRPGEESYRVIDLNE